MTNDEDRWSQHVETKAALTGERWPGDKPCHHDTIAEAGGLRVCMDCGEPNPKRSRRRV